MEVEEGLDKTSDLSFCWIGHHSQSRYHCKIRHCGFVISTFILCTGSFFTGRNYIDRTVGSDKEIFMVLFPVLYMEAKKSPKTVSFPFGAFMVLKSEKRECSAPLWFFNLSKLMGAANSIVYRFVSILFVMKYMKVVYLTTKPIQIKLYTIYSSYRLGLKLKDHREALHSPFFTILHNKRNIFSF